MFYDKKKVLNVSKVVNESLMQIRAYQICFYKLVSFITAHVNESK